jgi:hypothetical protein
MRDIARQAIREYIEQQVRADSLGQATAEQFARYADAFRRLGE